MITFVFDIDDCLYQRSTPFIQACKDVLAPKYSLDWMQLFKLRAYYGDMILSASQSGEVSLQYDHFFRLSKALSHFNQTTNMDEVNYFEERYDYYQSQIRLDEPFDTLIPYLYSLNISMGVLTNGPSQRQFNKAKTLGLDQYISSGYWTISGDYGIIKPNPDIFHIAQSKLHNCPENIYMIGDNYTSDILGANQVGWKTIWYNHAKKTVENSVADYTAETPQQLQEIILDIIEKNGATR